MPSFQGAFVDNAWTAAAGLGKVAVLNPATGKEIGSVSACGAAEVDAALAAAQRASSAWGLGVGVLPG